MKCIHCGTTRYSTHEMEQDHEGNFVCPECAMKFYKNCSRCGKLFLDEKLGKNKCDSCENLIYSSDLNSYGTKPFPVFKNCYGKDYIDMGCRYYGLEIELNNTSPSEFRKLAKELYDEKFIYNKSDASISNGVEVVTSPLDRKTIPIVLDRMEDALKYASKRDYSSRAGIHIHVNKKSIDAIDRYKLSILLNTYSSRIDNAIIYFISNRNSNVNNLDFSDGYCTVGSSRKINYKNACLDRHIALNIKNKFTFEFRLFKSSTDKKTILSYIDIVDSMIEFCHNTGLDDINVSNYIIYLKKHCKNEIILDKIKKFESAHASFKPCKNYVNSSELYKYLKGISWEDYDKVLTEIQSCQNNKEVRNVLANLNISNVTPSDFIEQQNTEFGKRLVKVIKGVLVNKIMKEVEKCA